MLLLAVGIHAITAAVPVTVVAVGTARRNLHFHGGRQLGTRRHCAIGCSVTSGGSGGIWRECAAVVDVAGRGVGDEFGKFWEIGGGVGTALLLVMPD